MKRFFCGWLLLLMLLPPLRAQDERVKTFLVDPALSAATFGFRIVDIETEKEITSWNGALSITPASVFKLLTTSVVLDLYKPEYRFTTQLAYAGTIDASGTLLGDLCIVGGGDPTLGSRYSSCNKNEFIGRCIAAIKKAGIKKIDGQIISDATIFGTEGVSNRWVWEDMGNYYGAGAYGINYNDNLYEITFQSGNVGTTPRIVKTVPNMNDIKFTNYLKSSTISYDSAFIRGAPYVHERELAGAIPHNREAFTIKGDIPDPALFLAKLLAQKIKATGILITQAPTTQRIRSLEGKKERPVNKELMSFESDPLGQIVHTVNFVSNNQFTEVLLRHIARKVYPDASIQNGADVVRKHLVKKGINTNGLFMYDGSGLSPLDRVSVNILTDLLAKMYKTPDTGGVFFASLPSAGQEATLRNFLQGTSLEGKLRLKSGSISNVQCYAGYTTGTKKYAIAVMVNNYTCSRNEINRKLEKLLLSYADILDSDSGLEKKRVTADNLLITTVR